jgi:hypothetical protein
VNKWVDLDGLSALSIGFCSCLLELNVSFVQDLYFIVHILDNFIRDLVRADCDAKIIGSPSQNCAQQFADFIIKVIHAKVQVFELRIFDCDPLLNLDSFFILACDLFNIV